MKFFILALFINTIFFYGQNQNDSIKTGTLNEVIITTPKLLKAKAFQSQKIESLGRKEIEFQNFQNTADLISNSGIATVQKSQQGGGSLVLRGFEASRIVLLVDGIRLNNLIFRTGHLQNIISVDKNSIDNIDVVYGSASTLFGSDALGGAINMTTKKAAFWDDKKKSLFGNFITRYSSSNNEKSGHFNINFANANFASLTSLSYSDYGDLLMGKRKNQSNDFFGERNFYVKTINGQDILVANENKYLQKFSGFKQYDFMKKLLLKQKNGSIHSINFQYSTTTNINRYDRLTDPEGAGLKFAEWYYGPQKRVLAVYSFTKNQVFAKSDLSIDLNYQNLQESRHNRTFGNYDLENRIEKVSVLGLDIVVKRNFKTSEIQYGFESYFDNLKSIAFSNNITTGALKPIDTRYPNGENFLFRNDLFFGYNATISEQTNFNVGSRIGTTTLKSSIADNTVISNLFANTRQSNITYSASAGIIHKPNKNLSLISNISSGFRSPNIDDLAKIFDSSEENLIIPNENLKPEKTITADLGIRFGNKKKRFEFEINYFYTKFIDAIVTDKFKFNGSESIVYKNKTYFIFANQNKRKAYITGISSNLKYYLIGNLLMSANINYTIGRISGEQNQPLDHIAPLFGKVGLSYSKSSYSIEAYLLFNGKKNSKDYLLNGEDNEQYAPKNGIPAWQTYTIKASILLFKDATLFSGIENILDIQYRTFASGMNAPGRNIYGGLKYGF